MRCASARSCCRRICSVCSSCLSAAFSCLDLLQRDVAGPHAAHAVDQRHGPALHFGERAERDHLQQREARGGVDLRGDQDDVQEDGGGEQHARPLSMSASAIRSLPGGSAPSARWSRSINRSRSCAADRTRRASCRRRAPPTTADLRRSTPAGRSLRAGACRGCAAASRRR